MSAFVNPRTQSVARPMTLVSSVGGFSQPATENIKTLHDLLNSIKPLKLKYFGSPQLQNPLFLGEGASYKVFRCQDVRSGSLVAVKKIKFSPENTLSNFGARIGSILRDIEVMNHLPLLKHSNILSILGYGWEVRSDGVSPFIVTEYAKLGTMRQYLLGSKTSGSLRRELCYQVASALHELHLSGVAHGDLKLENVLVELDSNDKRVPVRAILVYKFRFHLQF